jgi:hypothetical protein
LVLLIPLIAPAASPPDDFPRFEVPGHEKQMATLRDLFWLHYPGAGPKATLWDEWLTDASLWPAVTTGNQSDSMRQQWSQALSARILDPEGYVATHQHASIAHQLGWPFPFWSQGRHGCGWHFSFKNTAGEGWRPRELSKTDGWLLNGARDAGINEDGWRIDVTNAAGKIVAPAKTIDTFEAPFLQVRWQGSGLGAAQPFIEWTTASATNFSPTRRMYFEAPASDQIAYAMVPMYRHPQWTGEVSQLRIDVGNGAPGNITLQAFFTQFDTRHNINGQNFIRGCTKYFWWTRDLNFLRTNIQRMRTALHYIMTEHKTLEHQAVCTTWVGHDGRTGLKRAKNGKELIPGEGIGNNYWDLLPFGGMDCYATIQYYDALRTMAALEREIRAHPDWQMPDAHLAFDPMVLESHAKEVKAEGNHLFWNRQTGRFVACVDADGKTHDYGFTFLNCEAIYYDFATTEHAREILSWLDGERVVAGDTAQGGDIYHWRFAPRATTRRNLDWYFWAWSNPESIAWGGQVQDGGAVLGFSHHDLMARLKTLGPDNAWKRLQAILAWFDEVQAAGGYRKYYDGKREGSLQGGGTPGGLGLDNEFFESAMVPQVMLYGFLGFAPRADGFRLNPRLPSDWPELVVNKIRFQDLTLQIRSAGNIIEIVKKGDASGPVAIELPAGEWSVFLLDDAGSVSGSLGTQTWAAERAVSVDWRDAAGVRFERRAKAKK